jgi:hypothetical protein
VETQGLEESALTQSVRSTFFIVLPAPASRELRVDKPQASTPVQAATRAQHGQHTATLPSHCHSVVTATPNRTKGMYCLLRHACAPTLPTLAKDLHIAYCRTN